MRKRLEAEDSVSVHAAHASACLEQDHVVALLQPPTAQAAVDELDPACCGQVAVEIHVGRHSVKRQVEPPGRIVDLFEVGLVKDPLDDEVASKRLAEDRCDAPIPVLLEHGEGVFDVLDELLRHVLRPHQVDLVMGILGDRRQIGTAGRVEDEISGVATNTPSDKTSRAGLFNRNRPEDQAAGAVGEERGHPGVFVILLGVLADALVQLVVADHRPFDGVGDDHDDRGVGLVLGHERTDTLECEDEAGTPEVVKLGVHMREPHLIHDEASGGADTCETRGTGDVHEGRLLVINVLGGNLGLGHRLLDDLHTALVVGHTALFAGAAPTGDGVDVECKAGHAHHIEDTLRRDGIPVRTLGLQEAEHVSDIDRQGHRESRTDQNWPDIFVHSHHDQIPVLKAVPIKAALR